MPQSIRKPFALVFGLLFILFAGFQYNDPDPEIWIPIYGFAAMACFMAYAGVGRWWFFMAMALVFLIAAYFQWPPVFEGFLFSEVGMRSMNIELAREAGGLVICAIVMGLLALFARRPNRL